MNPKEYMLPRLPLNGTPAPSARVLDAVLQALVADIHLNPDWPTDPNQALGCIEDALGAAVGAAALWQPGGTAGRRRLGANLERTAARCFRALLELPSYSPVPLDEP